MLIVSGYSPELDLVQLDYSTLPPSGMSRSLSSPWVLSKKQGSGEGSFRTGVREGVREGPGRDCPSRGFPVPNPTCLRNKQLFILWGLVHNDREEAFLQQLCTLSVLHTILEEITSWVFSGRPKSVRISIWQSINQWLGHFDDQSVIS